MAGLLPVMSASLFSEEVVHQSSGSDSTISFNGEHGESNEEPYYFYQPLHYGTASLVHPLRLIINGAYGILQLDNRDNHIFDIDYRNGIENVWLNLRNPFKAIEQDGWEDFVLREIVPVSVDRRQGHYWPNYTQHLVGGGMSYRLMVEWFRFHEYRYPKMWAASTIAAYHFANEIIENNDYVGWDVDPIADLYIFDPLSILLFSSDRVCRFFSETLNMADWSFQPSYDPWRKTIENNGQNFVMKYPFPGLKKWSLFYHFGNHAELGVSRTLENGDCLSFGAGLKASSLIELGPGTRTVDLAKTIGIFYDRNNSLLAEVIWAGTKDYKWRVNLYPGLVHLRSFTPGLFLVIDQDNKTMVGVNLASFPVGLARRL